MARWVKFETADGGHSVLVNMDVDVLVVPEECTSDGRPAMTVCGQLVIGDVESLALMLGAETFGR